MANLGNFNANEVEPKQSFEPLPAGKYLAAITDSEMVRTNKNDGSYLKLTFQILDGEHKGRLLWVNLNLDNPTEKTVQIAKAELSAICRAVGVMVPKDSIELHNLPMVVNVKQYTQKDTGDVRNRISKYEKRPVLACPPTPPGTAPWRR